ncbi:MAG: carboxypeptidase regulatory-like domain-containing protein, partial [Acidobacteriaceae bacterium]|nr:carboxypeptidase regulatory-like domain-containing protein [Acidobacteriaceae bacterium]
MTKRALLASACLCILFFVSSAPLKPQVLYGSIVGAVMDPSKAAVPSAKVTITQGETNEQRTVTTDSSGVFSFPTIASGTYDVTVEKEGFETFTAQNVRVEVDQTARVNASLTVGNISQKVEVTSQTAELQTDSSEVRAEIGRKSLENLPVPVNRNYQNLLVMIPGFTPPINQNSQQANPAQGMSFSVNGATRNSNNMRIDGASSNNVWLAEVAGYVPGLESIDTVSVVTNSFDESQGLAGGAAVNVHIKSGTNEIHGSGFEYNINNDFIARPYFAPATQRQPKYINNDTGGTIGGPIIKNKLFYFVSYDGYFIRQNAGKYLTVPTAAIRSGDESASSTMVYDPNTGRSDGSGRTPFSGNKIPANRISPIAQKLVNITPLPNIPDALANNYYATGNYGITHHTSDA